MRKLRKKTLRRIAFWMRQHHCKAHWVNEFNQEPVELLDLAKKTGLSITTLRYFFQQHTGGVEGYRLICESQEKLDKFIQWLVRDHIPPIEPDKEARTPVQFLDGGVSPDAPTVQSNEEPIRTTYSRPRLLVNGVVYYDDSEPYNGN